MCNYPSDPLGREAQGGEVRVSPLRTFVMTDVDSKRCWVTGCLFGEHVKCLNAKYHQLSDSNPALCSLTLALTSQFLIREAIGILSHMLQRHVGKGGNTLRLGST